MNKNKDMDSNTFDVNKLLTAVDNEENEKFMSLNKELIQKYKNDILQNLQLKPNKLSEYHKKLKQYRFVDDLADIKYGSFIRWINIKNPDPELLKLTNGGIVTDIKFNDKGVQIQCKNKINRFFTIHFDDCIIFQKITQQESIILQIMDVLNK